MGCANSKVADSTETVPRFQVNNKKIDVKKGKENRIQPKIEKPAAPKATYATFQSSHSAKVNGETACSIRGSTFMPNGVLLVADYKNNKVKLFDSNVEFITDLELSSAPWDVCPSAIDEDDAYVSVPFKKDIHRVSIIYDTFSKRWHMESEVAFRTSGFCWGITCFEGGLAVSVKVSTNPDAWPKEPDYQIHLHDFDGTFKKAIVYNDTGAPYFGEPKYLNVTYDDLFLLVSDYKLNTVFCINNEDELIFAYTGMKCPNGITMDEQKSVHITSFYGKQRVHKVGANGKYVDGLPFSEDSPIFPHSICYRRKDKIIILATDNSLEVYKLVVK